MFRICVYFLCMCGYLCVSVSVFACVCNKANSVLKRYYCYVYVWVSVGMCVCVYMSVCGYFCVYVSVSAFINKAQSVLKRNKCLE